MFDYLNKLVWRGNGFPKKLRRRRSVIHSLFTVTAIAIVGATLISVSLARVESSSEPVIEIVAQDDTVDLPTPSRSLAKGELLSSADFRSVKWPKSKVGNSYVQTLEPYKHHFALTQLPANLPIPLLGISNSAPDANAVTDAIPQGMRAITVKVDVESAVEGWARTGNHVDVILVKSTKESGYALESLVIAENIRILSAGATTSNSGSAETSAKSPNTVTLLVSQEDALKVKTAANIGRLTFALRGNGDASPTLTTSIDGRHLSTQQRLESKSQVILGRAKGPDGKTYILDQESKWLRSSDGDEESSEKRKIVSRK